MDKTNQKNKKYTYDQKILDALVTKYGMTKVYIRMCLRGDNKSLTADKVQADYKILKNEINETLMKFNDKTNTMKQSFQNLPLFDKVCYIYIIIAASYFIIRSLF